MEITIDLKPDQLHTILRYLEEFIPTASVWAYGSRVKGTAHAASDLDLVAFTTKEQQPQVSLLKEALEESNLPFRVDLFVWNEVPQQFHKNIQQEHVVLQ